MGEVDWISVWVSPPCGKVVLLKTDRWFFVHCMEDKAGNIDWYKQDPRWTNGAFNYEDVTHWARLR